MARGKDLESNTLYYTASTIAQVIAAIAAIMTALSFFRIAGLTTDRGREGGSKPVGPYRLQV